jgi:hypothetical protein
MMTKLCTYKSYAAHQQFAQVIFGQNITYKDMFPITRSLRNI